MPTRRTNRAPREPHVGVARILLADDQEEVRLAIAKLLEDEFDVIGTAENGQRAIELVQVLSPDVLVIDLCMPVLNGIEAAKRMLAANPSARIVFLTVEKDPDTCRAALETGACGYVLKPRLATDLIPAIELARDGRRFVSPGCE